MFLPPAHSVLNFGCAHGLQTSTLAKMILVRMEQCVTTMAMGTTLASVHLDMKAVTAQLSVIPIPALQTALV